MVAAISICVLITGIFAIHIAALGILRLLLVRTRARPTNPTTPSTAALINETRERKPVAVDQESFIPMPDHLKSHTDMIAWMTKELPRLIEGVPTKPHGP
ncbi:hypothetical protein [Microvirga aerophila]|uniref:Uncharacterized protein n=1 Tax=Microvirga aerophila TaxID=670291 RepID=A0A512C1G8_9HYPH|nr:hypothetical protein [Microvirga aerophila]GEO18056.1 hypothetical protein MAE02_57520 [Microvirga aerophila]